MVQAARSGVQNIAEGSQASATSKKTELKLTNVARASLEDKSDQSDKADVSDRESLKAEVTANCALVLIEQATYLQNRLIERLARDFVDEGGFTERLYRVRTEARGSRK